MALPWFKTPAEDSFRLHAIGPANEGYYHALLRIKGRGQLDEPLDFIHIPQFHSKLTSWVAKLIGISKQRAAKLKETLFVHGLIDDYWQPIDWEQLYGPGAHRQGEGSADKVPSSKQPMRLTDEEKRKRNAEKQARYRQSLKEKAGVTDRVTGAVTSDVTRGVTATLPAVTSDVTQSTVTRPESSPKKLIENQQVTRCVTKAPLDLDFRALDSRSLKAKATHARQTDTPAPDSLPTSPAQAKAKATREPSAQAQPSTPGLAVTHVTGKATATATATADDLPLADRSLPAPTTQPQTHPAQDCAPDAEPLANPDSDLSALEAPLARANDPDKGFIHADPKAAKNEPLQPVGENPIAAPAKKYPAAKISLKHYLQIRRERGLNVIDDDHPIDQWAKERNFPPEFLAIAWEVFEEKYIKSFNKCYDYERWQNRFFEAVKGNQYGLWHINRKTKLYYLSDKGLEAFMDIDIKKNAALSQTEIKEPIHPVVVSTTDIKPDNYDGGAWFLAELKRRCGDELSGIFSSQQLINNANAY